jgi:hypothetical protein
MITCICTVRLYTVDTVYVSTVRNKVVLYRKEWFQLMKVANEYLDTLIRKPELLAWYIKCLHYNTYCKPPVTDIIDFKSL